MRGAGRATLAVAAIVLLVTAGFHATGYSAVNALLGSSGIASGWAGGLRGLWLIFALHLGIIGIIVLATAAKPEMASRGMLVALGLIPALDALVLLSTVGIFPGNVLLALAAVGIFLGAAMGAGDGGAYDLEVPKAPP